MLLVVKYWKSDCEIDKDMDLVEVIYHFFEELEIFVISYKNSLAQRINCFVQSV